MTKRGTWLSLVLAIGLGFGGLAWTPGPGAAAETTVRVEASDPAGPAARPSSGGAEVQDYARREASSRGLEGFSGGDDVVYISGGAILLAIILILILL